MRRWTCFEANLHRTSPADRLHRSFAITRTGDGNVKVPTVLSGAAFVKSDKATPKRDDWWVFAVDAVTHTLPENSRAVFDRVADDPDDHQDRAHPIAARRAGWCRTSSPSRCSARRGETTSSAPASCSSTDNPAERSASGPSPTSIRSSPFGVA